MTSSKCTATTAAGNPCKNWSMHGTNPPLCAAHMGMLGAQPGNSNAVKHGFYRDMLSPDEITALITYAENDNLDDELAISRVMLRRLMDWLKEPDLPAQDLAAIAPLIFTGSRTVAHLLRERGADGRLNVWDEVLDMFAGDFALDL